MVHVSQGHIYQGEFSEVSVHYSPRLVFSGGGAVGGMLGWPNGADPPPSHGWCQCQHIDFVRKWPPTNQLTPCSFQSFVCQSIAHNTVNEVLHKYRCYVGQCIDLTSQAAQRM